MKPSPKLPRPPSTSRPKPPDIRHRRFGLSYPEPLAWGRVARAVPHYAGITVPNALGRALGTVAGRKKNGHCAVRGVQGSAEVQSPS